jgi:hypothetical protein
MAVGGVATHTGHAAQPGAAQSQSGVLDQLLNFFRNLGLSGAEEATSSDDAIESLLKGIDLNGLRWIRNSRFLRIDYKRLKDRPAERRRATKNQSPGKLIYSCDQLMCHWHFKPPDASGRNSMTGSQAWTTISTQDSFSDWACRIFSDLQAPNLGGLRLM